MSSTKISSGLALSTSFYLRKFYNGDSSSYKTSTRSKLTNDELSYVDSNALKRAAAKLSKKEYSDNTNTDDMANSVIAFATTYNNALSSAKSDSSLHRYASSLKQLSKTNEEALSKIGITVNSDGTLDVNSTLIAEADPEDVGAVFSEKSDFTKSARAISRKINSTTGDNIRQQMTGTGMKINIVL